MNFLKYSSYVQLRVPVQGGRGASVFYLFSPKSLVARVPFQLA